jgi:uncharacterized protein YjbI with pentapeptide repeats
VNTQTAITLSQFHQVPSTQQYHVIANESIQSRNYKGLTISGSLLSQTTFREVTFESCVFFGTYIEHCEFIGCTFIDCKFEFSKVYDCNFNACNMQNCTWENTPIKTTLFCYSFVDLETAVNSTYYNSLVENCYIPAPTEKEIEDTKPHYTPLPDLNQTQLNNFYR